MLFLGQGTYPDIFLVAFHIRENVEYLDTGCTGNRLAANSGVESNLVLVFCLKNAMPNIAILDQINSTNVSELKQIYKPAPDYSGFVTSLALTINLKSITSAEFPYIPDDTPADVLEQMFQDLDAQLIEQGQFKELRILMKKGTGTWIEKAKIRLFNKEPYYEVDLMPYFSKSNTIDVAEDLSIGLQLALGTTLAADIDKILIFGTVIEEKKNNGNEELAARIEALELALAGRLTDVPANSLLGRGQTQGAATIIPASNFATPAQVAQQIAALSSINYSFRAAKTNPSQSVTLNTWNKVVFTNEIIDTNNQYNNTTSRLVAATTETWSINAYVTLNLSVNSRVLISIWKNGIEIPGSRAIDVVATVIAATSDFGLLVNTEFSLIANDYVEVYVYATNASSGSVSIVGEPQLLATSWAGKRIK